MQNIEALQHVDADQIQDILKEATGLLCRGPAVASPKRQLP